MDDAAFTPTIMASPPPAPIALSKNSISPFYYSLLAIASTALLLVAYNIIVVRWCWQRHRSRSQADRAGGGVEELDGHGVPSYKYKKEEVAPAAVAHDNECSVCLSGFLDGEDVRKLPKCKHLFHSECIDMWLYSHSNCPLCRAEVATPVSNRGKTAAASAEEEEHSRQDLLLSGSIV